RFPQDSTAPNNASLVVYAYPQELNYQYIETRGWFNLEVFNKNGPRSEDFELRSLLPDTFLSDTLDGEFSGKWIYLSMGSMGSIDVELMKRLVSVLAKSKHKYIVSKGP